MKVLFTRKFNYVDAWTVAIGTHLILSGEFVWAAMSILLMGLISTLGEKKYDNS